MTERGNNNNQENARSTRRRGKKKKKAIMSANNNNNKNNNNNTTTTNKNHNQKTKQQNGPKSSQQPNKKVKLQEPKDNGSLPVLVPVKGTNFNASKGILATIYVHSLSHSVYHVWLDCLWSCEVTYQQVIAELKPALAGARPPKPKDIFIVAADYREEVIHPNGSCFILLSNKIKDLNIDGKSFGKRLNESKLKMIEVNIAMLREHIKNMHILIFSEGHKNTLSKFPQKMILKSCQQQQPGAQSNQAQANESEPTHPQPINRPTIPRQCKQVAPVIYPRIDRHSPSLDPISTRPENMEEADISGLALIRGNSVVARPKTPEIPEIPKQVVKQSKRNAASLGQCVQLKKDKAPTLKNSSELDTDTFESLLGVKVERELVQRDVVVQHLSDLVKHGTIVIKVENLPAKLTIYALNLMMGTYTIKSDQVIAAIISSKGNGKELMNIRIVMKPNNMDVQRILSKNRYKTAYDTVLIIARTDVRELEQFLLNNHTKLKKLETDDRLPVNRITFSDPINVPNWATGYNYRLDYGMIQ